MIEVCCGLILNNQYEVLMTLRDPDGLRPNMWEMPGGKKDPGETDAQCLARELREELGVVARVLPTLISLDTFEWDGEGGDLDFVFVQCRLYHAIIESGNPMPLQSKALAHYDMRHANRRVPMCPSAYKFYPYVQRHIASLRRADELR
jgi:mutator protein MutT